MANYEACARTNYFRVKDEDAFRAWLEPFGDTRIVTNEWEGEKYFALVCESEGFPSSYFDENDNDVECDLPSEIHAHLKDGEVAVFIEVGHEKLRYLAGVAIAAHSDGRVISMSLDDIYARARTEFGVDGITRAEY